MAITSNAETKDDKALAALHEQLHEGAEHDLRFLKRHVVVFDAETNTETRRTRKQYQDYLDELAGPEDGSEAAPEALPPQASEPRSGFATAPATHQADERRLQDLADLAFEVGVEERRGDLDKNSARFERGELMLRLADLAKSERVPFKDVLSQLNERMAKRAAENTLPDFQVITKEEATTTRRVVESFGSGMEFKLVNYTDPNTGEPFVDDSGEPPRRSIREVPINKLYAIVDYAGEKDLDTVLSFAYRYSEKVVKKAKSVAKNQGKSLVSLIKKLDKLKADAVHPVTGATIKVQAGERAALEKLRDLAGEAPPPDVVSIKTDRAWAESFWEPLKALFSAVQREFNPDMMGDATEVSNVYVFERTIGQFFNVNEESGLRGAIGALIEAQDITPEQAQDFFERFAFNPGSGEWESDAAAAPAPGGDEDEGFEEDDEDEGFDDIEVG